MSLEISPLITQEQIESRVKEIGARLTDQFNGKNPVAVCILKGSVMFYSDLIREIKTDLNCEFLAVSSYGNSSKSTGEVKLVLDLNSPIKGKDLLIVEDIVDTGLTMSYLIQNLESRKPASITTASLLLKPDALKTNIKIDHVGFEIPNDFVVGYGLDYQGRYRNLPFIGQVSTLN